MTSPEAAGGALAHARALAARGAGLTDAMRQERAQLRKAIDAELVQNQTRIAALRDAAQAGDRDAAARIVAMTEAMGDLQNARAALEGAA